MSNPGPSTRQKTQHPSLKTRRAALPKNQLPWKMDVYSFYVKTRDQMTSASGKKPTRREVAEVVKDAIIETWDRANIISWSDEGEKTNIISEARIVRNIVSLAEMGLDLKKWSPGRKKGKGKKYTGKMQIYDGLFDIMWCRCDVTNTGVPCARCPAAKRVPAKEVAFLVDQRTERKLHIGGIDWKTTEENIRKQKKRGTGKKQLDKKDVQQSSEVKRLSDMDADVKESSEDSEMDGVEEAGASSSDSLSSDDASGSGGQNRRQLPNFSRMCDRYGTSDRSAAGLLNAALVDYGIITHNNKAELVDRNKIR